MLKDRKHGGGGKNKSHRRLLQKGVFFDFFCLVGKKNRFRAGKNTTLGVKRVFFLSGGGGDNEVPGVG